MHSRPTLRQIWRRSRTLRWGLAIVTTLVLAVALLMVFLLAQSTNTLELYERNYERLLLANLAVVALLVGVLGWSGWRIWRRYRRNQFGSRLTMKWVAVFVLVASLPGALIYTVSYQFVDKSIASWFDVKVETALDAGLDLGRNVLDLLLDDTAERTRASARRLQQAPMDEALHMLETVRSQINVDQVQLWTVQGQPLAGVRRPQETPARTGGAAGSSSEDVGGIRHDAQKGQHGQPDTPIDFPDAAVLEQLHRQPVTALLEGVDDATALSVTEAGSAHRPASTDWADAAPTAVTPAHIASHMATHIATAPARVVAYSLITPGQAARVDRVGGMAGGGVSVQQTTWILGVSQRIAPELLRSALLVQEANRAYQERAVNRRAMQRLFLGTLSLILVLAIFAAVLMAALLAGQLARPLLLLAEGVRQVAQGDLGPKPIYQGQDELGRLTHAFADMTRQLADTRQALTSSVAELDAARQELQTILDNLSTGVLIVRMDGHVLSANPGAARILGVELGGLVGGCLQDFAHLLPLAALVQQQFDALADQPEPGVAVAADAVVPDVQAREQPLPAHQAWQQMLQLHAAEGESLLHDGTTLIVRGALLPDAAIVGARLLVCEDVSAIVSAQRAQAWAEVARRLAHEIKNPLTPIQLSAERMQRRLMASLPEPEQAILEKSVRTIVTQVDAMKRLVNEFRDYARLPAAQLQPLDLNALIADVLQLYETGSTPVPIQPDLDAACQPIMADAQQLRQVLHNLLQNAQDAQEQNGHTHQPVCIQTQWRPASQRVRLNVIDCGPGFPEHILQRAFEPYVTTKAKGTGLGLAVVKKIADDHRARLGISNRAGEDGSITGAQVTLMFEAAASTQAHAEVAASTGSAA